MKVYILLPSHLQDIFTPTWYVLDNTMARTKTRAMFSLYFVCVMEDLAQSDDMEQLVEAAHGFVLGLIRRLSGMRSKHTRKTTAQFTKDSAQDV